MQIRMKTEEWTEHLEVETKRCRCGMLVATATCKHCQKHGDCQRGYITTSPQLWHRERKRERERRLADQQINNNNNNNSSWSENRLSAGREEEDSPLRNRNNKQTTKKLHHVFNHVQIHELHLLHTNIYCFQVMSSISPPKTDLYVFLFNI